jgi:hypothetical protein
MKEGFKKSKNCEATFTLAPANPHAPAKYVLQNKLFFII